MPRTLSTELTNALNSGNFTPYFRLTIRDATAPGHTLLETVEPVAFKLSGTILTAKFVRQTESLYTGTSYFHEREFELIRGVTIDGVNYTITSSRYWGIDQNWDGTFQYVTGCLFPHKKYTDSGYQTYQTIINNICSNFGKTATYDNPAAAWLGYKFLATGKTLTLNRASDFFNLLQQKYLIFACDNGGNDILFKAIGTDSDGTTDHTISMPLIKQFNVDALPSRRFLWRDEVSATHFDGNAIDPLWNLGYLESTASPPTGNSSVNIQLHPIAPHLKYLTFDRFDFTFENYPSTTYVNTPFSAFVEEEYNYQFPEIPWRINLSSFNWAKGTEGGSLPGTIEQAAPYTPINTSQFSNNLNANVNNLQALADAVDNLTIDIAASTHAASNKATLADNDEFPLADSAASYVLKHALWANMKDLIRTYLATYYADIAKGVTNGDSHDHNGGDGAAIAYSSLSAAPGVDGWTAISATGTSGTLDSPVFEISFNADMTGIIGLGDRIKITQSTTKYFIVVKVGAFSGGATVISCYGGTDYTLVASGTTAITNPYYSHDKAPFGFPLNPTKWTVTTSDTTDRTQTTPTTGTWYNPGSIQISAPIGVWRTSYHVLAGADKSASATLQFATTLSTANNSESDATTSILQTLQSGTFFILTAMLRNHILSLTTKTTHYLNIHTFSFAADHLYYFNSVVTLTIKLECAYL